MPANDKAGIRWCTVLIASQAAKLFENQLRPSPTIPSFISLENMYLKPMAFLEPKVKPIHEWSVNNISVEQCFSTYFLCDTNNVLIQQSFAKITGIISRYPNLVSFNSDLPA